MATTTRTCVEEDCTFQLPTVPGGGPQRCPEHRAARRKAQQDERNHVAILRKKLARPEPLCVECGAPVDWKNRTARAPRRCPLHRYRQQLVVHRDAKRARAAVRLQQRQSAAPLCGQDGCPVRMRWVFTRYQEFCTEHRAERAERQRVARVARVVQQRAEERGFVQCGRCQVYYHPIRTWTPPKPCRDCREELQRERNNARSRRRDPEERRRTEKAWRARNPDKVRDKNYARRVAMTGAEAEFIPLRELAVRDDFCCGICGNDVDITLPWPDPDSATIDHIIPVIHDGPHTWANVRLAHKFCNESRGARGEY